MRRFAAILFALTLFSGPVVLAGPAAAATLNAPSEGPSVDSEEVIALAQRIKTVLMRLQPCPSTDVARYAIGAAVEGVKIEVVLVALSLQRTDEDLCRGARRAVAQAYEDARLALASIGATGGPGAVAGPGTGGPPRSPLSLGSLGALGGLPGGGGGSAYRPGS